MNAKERITFKAIRDDDDLPNEPRDRKAHYDYIPIMEQVAGNGGDVYMCVLRQDALTCRKGYCPKCGAKIANQNCTICPSCKFGITKERKPRRTNHA